MGTKLVAGENDLATIFPTIALYYDSSKNGNTAHDIQARSNKNVWWTCDNGHSFSMKVLNRVRREKSCPYCSGQKLLAGFNDLQTVNPEVAKEWDCNKNIGTPSDYRYGSGYKAWWVCNQCGESYQSPINIHIRGHKCPYCSGNKVKPGKTDLQTLFPEIAQDYAPDNIFPVNFVAAGSHDKVKWVCPNCHKEYWSSPHHRTSKDKTECPFCKKQSKGERKIKKVLDEYGVEYKSQDGFDDLRGDGGRPLKFDFTIYANGKLVGAIEYQGEQHYKPVAVFGGREAYNRQHKHDNKKVFYCLEHMIPLLLVSYDHPNRFMSIEDEVVRFLNNIDLVTGNSQRNISQI